MHKRLGNGVTVSDSGAISPGIGFPHTDNESLADRDQVLVQRVTQVAHSRFSIVVPLAQECRALEAQ